MKIISVNLKNYKSISDTNKLITDSKINIFAGKNNTGKTSFIEALYTIANGQLQSCLQMYATCDIELYLNNEDLTFLNNGVMDPLWNIEKIKVYFHFHETNVTIKKIEFALDEYVTLWENKTEIDKHD